MYCYLIIVEVAICISTGATVTDHIPVDDNPVYITMKKIDMNKNTAYEVVHLETKMN